MHSASCGSGSAPDQGQSHECGHEFCRIDDFVVELHGVWNTSALLTVTRHGRRRGVECGQLEAHQPQHGSRHAGRLLHGT